MPRDHAGRGRDRRNLHRERGAEGHYLRRAHPACGHGRTIPAWRWMPWAVRRESTRPRYAGPGPSDADRYRKLLDALAGVPWARRTARFAAWLLLATPAADVPGTGDRRSVTGRSPSAWHVVKQCADRRRRVRGDHRVRTGGQQRLRLRSRCSICPIAGSTMAQLPAEDKNETSHRGRAARAAETLLDAMLRG